MSYTIEKVTPTKMDKVLTLITFTIAFMVVALISIYIGSTELKKNNEAEAAGWFGLAVVLIGCAITLIYFHRVDRHVDETGTLP